MSFLSKFIGLNKIDKLRKTIMISAIIIGGAAILAVILWKVL
jgi:hypothetical protein